MQELQNYINRNWQTFMLATIIVLVSWFFIFPYIEEACSSPQNTEHFEELSKYDGKLIHLKSVGPEGNYLSIMKQEECTGNPLKNDCLKFISILQPSKNKYSTFKLLGTNGKNMLQSTLDDKDEVLPIHPILDFSFRHYNKKNTICFADMIDPNNHIFSFEKTNLGHCIKIKSGTTHYYVQKGQKYEMCNLGKDKTHRLTLTPNKSLAESFIIELANQPEEGEVETFDQFEINDSMKAVQSDALDMFSLAANTFDDGITSFGSLLGAEENNMDNMDKMEGFYEWSKLK